VVRFVGRVGEFAALAGLLDRAGAGRTGIALVSGEPGIGKTQLLAEFGRIAVSRGFTVARGRASDEEGAPAFWLWRQVVRSWAGPAELPVPDFTADGPVTAEQRFTVFERFGQFLTNAAAHNGLVVLLDDLHWADAGSLSLLAHLVRQQPEGRLLIVGCARPVELAALPLGPELRTLIGRYENGALLELSGLSTAEVGALLTSLLGERPEADVIDVVRGRTRGNPLFVQEVSRLLASGRSPAGSVPEVIRSAIHEHLAGLSEDCRRTLTIAALIGSELDVNTLAALTGTSVQTVLAHVDQAQQASVVTPELAFHHDLFRETLQLDMPGAQRAATHLQVAEHLAGTGRILEIARHRLAALPLGDATLASSTAQAAGHEALAGLAFENAVELFDKAYAVAPVGLPAARRCELLIDAGRAHFLKGDIDGAIQRCTEAAELAQRTGDAENLGRAALALPELTEVQWLPLVESWCEQALAGLSEEDSPVRAQLLAQQALAFVLTENTAGLEESSTAALAMARRLDDDPSLRIALRAKQVARSSPDGHAERLLLGDEMVHLGRRTGDSDAVFWGHLWRFDAMVQVGRIEEAGLELSKIDPVVNRLGRSMTRWHLARCRAALATARGRFDQGRRYNDEVRALVPEPRSGSFWGAQALLISRLTGVHDVDINPHEWVRRAEDHPLARVTILIHMGPWHLAYGRVAEAEDLYRSVPAINTVHIPPYATLVVHAAYGAVAAALGDSKGAASAYSSMLPHADLHVTTGAGQQITLGSAQQYLGLTAPSPDVAIEHMRAAIVANDESGLLPFAAESRYHLARLLSSSDVRAAKRLNRDAIALASNLGMAPLLSQATELDASLRERSPANPLTPRQREVAHLVAQGSTNRQVAAALSISERTAESHVQNIMTTLGFQSRSQIAAWTARQPEP
jgi:DNA-binding CsgD family transcriptional regulator